MARAKRTKETIDLKTGEVVLKESWYHYKGKGIHWFKVDFSFVNYLLILNIGDVRVLFEVSRMMNIENEFVSNKESLNIISTDIDVSLSSIKRCLARLVEVGLMLRGGRGVLYVNPNIISYGSGENLIKARERFKNVVQIHNQSKT
jgi:hypothetical protein